MLCLATAPGFAGTVPVLGSAVGFAVLGNTTVTNIGSTTLTGSSSVTANLGLYPGTAITGLGPGADQVTFTNGVVHTTDMVAQQAQADLLKAYTALSLLPVSANVSGQNLGDFHTGGLGALGPGVYKLDAAAAITGTLELDAQNTDGAYWVFQIGSTLTATAGNALVKVIQARVAGNNGADIGVFWLVGTSATLGTGTTLAGNLLAQASITLNTSAAILNGRALALGGAVTLDTNTIRDFCPDNNNGPGFSGGLVFASEGSTVLVPIPEPSMFGVLALFLTTLWGYGRRHTFAAGGF